MEVLQFAWWNTGLAPPTPRVTPTAENRVSVAAVIAELVLDQACALIGVAEVWKENPIDLVPESARPKWRCVNAAKDDGEVRHDVALLYDSTRLAVIDFTWLGTWHDGRRVKPGLVVNMRTENGPLVIAVAHWSSDMGDSEHARARRQRAAEALRYGVANAVQLDIPVMVMGDLNLEPFDPSLTAFPTSRAREVVRRHKPRDPTDTLFYNASWRWMGERHAGGPDSPSPSIAGTYWNSSQTSTSWRTFDHVMVSAALLGNTGWVLSEAQLGVWAETPHFDDWRAPRAALFDHLPIVGLLRWCPALTAEASSEGAVR